jgi:hypothetical protein
VSKLDTVEAMIAAYNAQNADAYVEFMTNDASEANYRGAVVREGKEGVRSGLKAIFADFPENRVSILDRKSLGDYVVLRESVFRGEKSDGTPCPAIFEVIVIYTFEGDKCSRVEFVR